jgi:hypothetical protein
MNFLNSIRVRSTPRVSPEPPWQRKALALVAATSAECTVDE